MSTTAFTYERGSGQLGHGGPDHDDPIHGELMQLKERLRDLRAQLTG